MVASSNEVVVTGEGAVEPPVMLARTVLLLTTGNCDGTIVPEISVKAGCVAPGTPEVEIVLIHFEV